MKLTLERLPKISSVVLIVFMLIAVWLQISYQRLVITFVDEPFQLQFDQPEEAMLYFVESHTGSKIKEPVFMYALHNTRTVQFTISKGIVVRSYDIVFDVLYRGISHDILVGN